MHNSNDNALLNAFFIEVPPFYRIADVALRLRE
jgi:hypothetical protein